MAGVDLGVFDFDHDLTFCALLMDADGTILHTYGGRDATGPESHLSEESLLRALARGQHSHAAHAGAARPERRTEPQTIESLPWMARRIASGKSPACFHCHMVNDARREEARERGRWRREHAWRWPDPVQAGLHLDRDDPQVVTGVEAGSPADRAGLSAGDRLVALGGRAVATFGDVQRVLDETSGGATSLPAVYERAGTEAAAKLRLPAHWRQPDPAVFAWRPTKWGLGPRPGFGGPQLDAAGLRAARLPADAYTGRNAQKAGLRKGDVVIAVGGQRDFESVDHFHAWYRLTRRPGETLDVEILRDGAPRVLRMRVVE
jgi:hypothetical protein